MNLTVKQTNAFKKSVKKLHPQQKKELDVAIRSIIQEPSLGQQKKGDLLFLRVYKFKMNRQETLLGYHFDNQSKQLHLLSLGSHENFYRDLKH